MNTYRKFTRAEWIAFGKRFSVVARELICLEKDLSQGLSILKLKPFHLAQKRVNDLRFHVERCAQEQHPDWVNCCGIFFGHDDPDEKSE